MTNARDSAKLPAGAHENDGAREGRAPFRWTSLRGDERLEEERDDEAEEHERLDQREAENHRGLDARGGARVTRDALERGSGRAALTEGATEDAETDGEACAARCPHVHVVLVGARLSGLLRERSERNEKRGDEGEGRGAQLAGAHRD